MEWKGVELLGRMRRCERGRVEEGKLQGENPHDMQNQTE